MIEVNTAVDAAISNSKIEIQLFQDQFQRIVQIVLEINDSLLPEQKKLIIKELTSTDTIIIIDSMITDLGKFSDLIMQRGKDILLLADQAQQFICVSNDAFDRVIDNWNWLTSRHAELVIINKISILKEEVIALVLNLNNRKDLITDEELLITQALLDEKINILEEHKEIVISTILNVIEIFKKSFNITSVFKNVLAVNTTVGIALAVTDRAWDIMIRMNQHNYSTTTTIKDQEIISAASTSLTGNSLFPVSMIEREKQVNSWMNKMLIVPGLDTRIEIQDRIYKFSNKRDAVYSPQSLPSTYNTLSTPQIVERYNDSQQIHIVPDILLEIISDVALITTIGVITPDMLTTWYNNQIAPDYSIEQLIFESDTREFLDWYYKYLNSSVIQETIQNILIKKQKMQMRDTLLEYQITTVYPEQLKIINYSKYNIDNKVLVSGTLAQVAFQQFLNEQLVRVSNSQEHLDSIDTIKGQYLNRLIPETESGQFTLAEYSVSGAGEEVLVKILDQFKYSYILYKDDLKIHYMEAKVNKYDYFLIKENTIQANYLYSEQPIKLITFVETSEHTVNLNIEYHGYLVDFDYTAPNYKINNMTINVDGIVEDKLNGHKGVITETYQNSLDDQGLDVITSTKDEIVYETHWVTNNLIERIATDITNVYRLELIEGRMDFTQARVNSIIETLRFLGYREELDKYIDDTWLYNIPRYTPQQ